MLDRHGYKRKEYSQILEEMQTRAKELFGEKTNLTERSVIGILLRIMAWFFSLVWKDNEDVYHSAYVNTSEGANLDRLTPYGGITRNMAQFASGLIEIQGTPNYVLPSGFVVMTESEIFFETVEDIVLDGTGEGFGEIIAVKDGQGGNVALNMITEIFNPSADVTSVTNIIPTSGGREKEIDMELRDRFFISVEGLGKATTPSIRASILRLPGVRAASIIENYYNEVVDGRPPKSIHAYVLGGNDAEIADAILSSKAGGIEPFGDVSVDAIDESGEVQLVRFSRAIEVPVYLKLAIKRNNSFAVDGEGQIKASLVRYIGGEDSTGSLYAGLNMGQDVTYSRLISIVYQTTGIGDVQLELSRDGSTYIPSNVVIGREEAPQTQFDFIEVTYV